MSSFFVTVDIYYLASTNNQRRTKFSPVWGKTLSGQTHLSVLRISNDSAAAAKDELPIQISIARLCKACATIVAANKSSNYKQLYNNDFYTASNFCRKKIRTAQPGPHFEESAFVVYKGALAKRTPEYVQCCLLKQGNRPKECGWGLPAVGEG
jgi:hypothetical protein